MGSAYEVFDDFTFFARKLRNLHPHINTGVISNFDKRLTSVLAQLGVAPFFDFVIFSEEAGVSKPDGEIFQAAIKKLGGVQLRPQEILHIGDDVEKDYFGAKNSGWNSIVLNRKSLPLDDFPNVPKIDICKDFAEIDEIFERRF
jgi:FMN phosphatase YigB (HAD superfamily)